VGVPTGPPLFFVESVSTPVLSDPDHHHAARVLRIRSGDPVTVSDGRGSWCSCRFGPSLVLDGEPEFVDAVTEPITVGFALTKATKPEFVVQKLTEVGVDRIVAFGADRSVVKWDDDKSATRLERWQGVAREAAMQSRRAWIPAVEPVTTFDDLLAQSPATVMADMVGRPLSRRDRFLIVGPEGGWSDRERSCGIDRVRIAPNVLRAETAAVMAGGLAVALRDELLRP